MTLGENHEARNFWVMEQETISTIKRVSMGLTDRRKTAKNLVDSRKD